MQTPQILTNVRTTQSQAEVGAYTTAGYDNCRKTRTLYQKADLVTPANKPPQLGKLSHGEVLPKFCQFQLDRAAKVHRCRRNAHTACICPTSGQTADAANAASTANLLVQLQHINAR